MTTTELRKEAVTRIGRRRKFCILGPEYFGCINTGKRARFAAYGNGVFGVGYEHSTARLYETRAAALTAFLRLSMEAVRYNAKARAEIASGNPQARYEHGV